MCQSHRCIGIVNVSHAQAAPAGALPDLNLVAVFDALLGERSVTRTAEQLGVTQSAMSHSLSRLRTWFADPLFVRVGSAMQPTPRALELAPVALQIMASVRSGLLSQAGFDPASSTRRFTLCMTDMGESVFLPPLIAQLRAQAPHCTPCPRACSSSICSRIPS